MSPAGAEISLRTVHPENTRAQQLYVRAGFRTTGELQSGEPVYSLPLSE